jgi:uncharacterized protein (DUF1778 family)
MARPKLTPPIGVKFPEPERELVANAAKKTGVSRHKFMQVAILAAAQSVLAA